MKTKAFLAVSFLFILVGHLTIAQDHHDQAYVAEDLADTGKIQSVRDIFAKGSVHGHIRNYTMATWNHQNLGNNFANAIGAEIGYKTSYYHHFRLGISGLFTYNAFSSAIDKKDDIAGKYPRWELELFDVEDPTNKDNLDRLDELFLEYNTRRVNAIVGRFSFNSPFINPQDGRMKPYTVQGISTKLHIKRSLLTLAWFDHFSPRSTVEWFKANETIGIYPMGVNQHGEPADYHHHIRTKGVAVTGLQMNPAKKLHAEVWNYWIDNISNNTYGRSLLQISPKVKLGLEGLYQFQVGNGGNQDQNHTYFPDQQQWVIGGMVAYEPKSWHFSVNYLHIGKEGRFLFPREWGREQFFATLPRGRMEGLGKSDLLVVKAKKHWSKQFTTEIAMAKSWLPDYNDFQNNKYKAESSWGWVADINYSPENPLLKGLSFRLLYVGRASPGTDMPLQQMYYNTNFHHLNLVTQITF